ncbi:MAG: hypothetical protein ACRD5Z_21155 [Bryobacteraceae bacterium]
MPAAVIAISMLVALATGTPSEASQQCMSKAEARQQFGSVHIYWHGRAHCWDATPPRRVHESRKSRPIKWRDAMSEILPEGKSGILPESKPVQTIVEPSWLERWVDIRPSQLPFAADSVDSARLQSPPIVERESRSGIAPRFLLLACIAVAIGLTLATIEFLFRRSVYD